MCICTLKSSKISPINSTISTVTDSNKQMPIRNSQEFLYIDMKKVYLKEIRYMKQLYVYQGLLSMLTQTGKTNVQFQWLNVCRLQNGGWEISLCFLSNWGLRTQTNGKRRKEYLVYVYYELGWCSVQTCLPII